MAKKTVATLQTGEGRNFSKVIKMVRSPKTGAYVFEERMVPNDKLGNTHVTKPVIFFHTATSFKKYNYLLESLDTHGGHYIILRVILLLVSTFFTKFAL